MLVRKSFPILVGLGLMCCYSTVPAQDEEERLFWETVRCEAGKEVRVYLEEYPKGAYVDEAIKCLQDIARNKDDDGAAKEIDNAPQQENTHRITDKLAQCQEHLEANRLTSGQDGTALECYQSVLELDGDNAEALAGLEEIEDTYANWARSAIEAGEAARAQRNLDKLKRLNPRHTGIPTLQNRLLSLEEKIKEQAQEDETQARKSFEPEMVLVEGKCFQMGSPVGEKGRDSDERQHRVCVEDFRIGKYEVTQAEWEEVMGSNPSYFKGKSLPVDSVRWSHIRKYIEKLNLLTQKAYRLPTEAEWEYACRSGSEYETFCGGDKIEEVAWYIKNSDKTNPVGSKKPNAFGLYDMSGNVSEWTCSAYDPEYTGKELECDRDRFMEWAVRGGPWHFESKDLRAASRFNSENVQFDYPGLRLVLD